MVTSNCDRADTCAMDRTCFNWHNCEQYALPQDAREEIHAAMLAVWVDRAERGVTASPDDHVDALLDAVIPIVERLVGA